MKAYHLEKARDPADLPPWLFEEHERRPLGRPSVSSWDRGSNEPGNYESRDDTAPPRGRGLRDVYDSAAATTTPTPSRQERREMPRGRQDDVDAGYSSKANNRLKALRDAKRDAVQRNASAADRVESTNDEWSSVQKEHGRGYTPNGSPAHGHVPSLPTSVRPGVGSRLRPSSRK